MMEEQKLRSFSEIFQYFFISYYLERSSSSRESAVIKQVIAITARYVMYSP